jgi:hypothetical protein
MSHTFRLSDMNNTCPWHPQNSPSLLPVAGYLCDISRLDKLWLSEFIVEYAAAADLMMQYHCEIEIATILLNALFFNQIHHKILVGFRLIILRNTLTCRHSRR